jgi:hypothetical protein
MAKRVHPTTFNIEMSFGQFDACKALLKKNGGTIERSERFVTATTSWILVTIEMTGRELDDLLFDNLQDGCYVEVTPAE